LNGSRAVKPCGKFVMQTIILIFISLQCKMYVHWRIRCNRITNWFILDSRQHCMLTQNVNRVAGHLLNSQGNILQELMQICMRPSAVIRYDWRMHRSIWLKS
jgi:hypothetical protein